MIDDTARLAPTAAALGSGEIDPETYAERCCDRADSIDPDVRALVPEPDRRARVLGEAGELADRFGGPNGRPPLFGVPVGVKDVVRVDGFPTRAGTDLPPGAFDGPEATVTTRLRDAGAIVLGKTVTTEFAYFSPGPTRNPHDLDHTPGGSSSGSAAAVAAGLCPLAIGSQTAGSVIRPAAFCGVVGFKPTYGRIPIDGVVPLAPSLDTLGTFTQDVAGARHAASVLCDEWEGDGGSAEAADVGSGGGPTLGVPDETYLARASKVGRERFEAHLERLVDAGYGVVRTAALADVGGILDRHATLMAAEAAAVHEEWFEAYGDRYAPVTAELVREGREQSASAIDAAREGQTAVRESLAEEAAGDAVDVWVAPSAPGPAPSGLENTGDPVMNAPWTYARLPAITVPGGAVDGLPVGLQCIGAHGADERLVRWAEPMAEELSGTGG